jgi:hypothetical protein
MNCGRQFASSIWQFKFFMKSIPMVFGICGIFLLKTTCGFKSPPGSCEANHSKPQPPKDATPLGIEQHYPPVIKHGVPENQPVIYIYMVGGFNPSEKY